jgi:hypothetical protein
MPFHMFEYKKPSGFFHFVYNVSAQTAYRFDGLILEADTAPSVGSLWGQDHGAYMSLSHGACKEATGPFPALIVFGPERCHEGHTEWRTRLHPIYGEAAHRTFAAAAKKLGLSKDTCRTAIDAYVKLYGQQVPEGFFGEDDVTAKRIQVLRNALDCHPAALPVRRSSRAP